MWQCLACGGRRGGPICKKWCVKKWGDMGAELWPLDGFIRFAVDPSIPEEQDMIDRERWFAEKRRRESD